MPHLLEYNEYLCLEENIRMNAYFWSDKEVENFW